MICKPQQWFILSLLHTWFRHTGSPSVSFLCQRLAPHLRVGICAGLLARLLHHSHPQFILQIHLFGAHTGQTHCWSQRCIWVAGMVSWPPESEEAAVSPFPSPLPTLRPLPPSPIHKHWQPFSLPPALKKSSLSQQLCDSGATNVLGVLQAMKSGMESSKTLGLWDKFCHACCSG